jgi:hypothetical protein
MIISASYKTDIPAWYGEWFMTRLRAGSCEVMNPYNNVPYTVSLAREAVDGFVFWTRNIGPFLKHLPEVRERGFPFIVHQGILGYPRELERTQLRPEQAARDMRELAETYHCRMPVWRYDPVLFTSLTPYDWHLENSSSSSNTSTVPDKAIGTSKTNRMIAIQRCTKTNVRRMLRPAPAMIENSFALSGCVLS